MAPPTPSDSAGGSNAATPEDALPPHPPAPAAHHAAPAPNLAQPPTANNHPPDAATPWMPPPAPAPAHPAHSHGGGGGGGGPQPAHSMQNSVFTARRWDRATGSTSTVGGVGGVRDSDRDSAGDSCAAVSTGDAPVDSTLAQHRLGARGGGGGGGAQFSEDEDGEEVEGTIARADRPTSVARAAGSARLGSSDLGPAAVDSAPVPVPVMRVGSIGDGFAETNLNLPFGPASVGMFAMGAGGGNGGGRRGRGKSSTDAHDAELGGDAAAYARRQPWDLRAEEMLPAAKTLQTRAAALFGDKNFAAAERAYDHALRFVEYEEAFDGDDAKADARRVKVDCLVDASACAMRRGDADKAQRAASRALHFDPGSVPALVRRATARAWGGGEMDAAIADLEQALKLAPNDADAAAEYARVRAMRADANPNGDGYPNDDGYPDDGNHDGYPNGTRNGHANGVARNGIAFGGLGGGGRGPATSALKGPPPVPLFNAARAPNETHSPMPPGTAAAARALAAEEAEGECDAQAGAGGMDIGAAAGSEDGEAHEHGYAPASSEEYAEGFGSPGGSVDARLGGRDGRGAPVEFADGGGGGFGGDDVVATPAPGSGGFNSGRATGPPPAPLDHGAAFFDSNRDRGRDQRARAAGTASGGFAPPNHPARAAVSGAAPHFSGPRGGLSAGPASGTVSGGGHLGPARSNGGAFPGPATDANGAANMGQTRSASVGRVSMQKNGPPAMARAVVDEGGDESEEDGEEGVSPEFVPADDDEEEGGDDRMDERD